MVVGTLRLRYLELAFVFSWAVRVYFLSVFCTFVNSVLLIRPRDRQTETER
jgi:hypothetical protein